MYEDKTQEAIQWRLRADNWQHNPEMELVAQRLERDPDDPKITATMRTQLAYYRADKDAAKAEGRDVQVSGVR